MIRSAPLYLGAVKTNHLYSCLWILVFIAIGSESLFSQPGDTLTAPEPTTSIFKKSVDVYGDFRFRLERDWGAHHPNFEEVEDRDRMRIRTRVGALFSSSPRLQFGAQFRTGNLQDQQGPHVTLGGGAGEFGLIRVGFEKAFMSYKRNNWILQLGKFSLPFVKQDEMFWNDNVYPEGASLSYNLVKADSDNKWKFTVSHFVLRAYQGHWSAQGSFNGAQVAYSNSRFSKLYASYYGFNGIGWIPDNASDARLDYHIMNVGGRIHFLQNRMLWLAVDGYFNLEDYSTYDFVREEYHNETNGLVVTVGYGKLEESGDWAIAVYGAILERFAVVDYLAQNDWARWDYSSAEVPGSRLTNFKGTEVRLSYAAERYMHLVLRYYYIEDIVKRGLQHEDGHRIRLDIDVSF